MAKTLQWVPAARLLSAVVFAAALLSVRPAAAKAGDGIEVGPGHLKLGFDINERFDNYAGIAPGNWDLITLIQPKFVLDMQSDTVFVNFRGALGWNQYSRPQDLQGGNDGLSFLSANVSGEIDVNRDRPVGFELTEFLLRSDQTTNPIFNLGVLALSDMTKARVHFRPGGGAIELGVSGEFDAGAYESQVTWVCPPGTNPSACPADTSAYNSIAGKAMLDGTWRFLPKTGIMFETSYASWSYTNSGPLGMGSVPTQPIVANLGFGTLLTARLSFTIKAGYSGLQFSKSSGVQQVNDWDGQAEIAYRFTDAAFARIGVLRNYTPVAGSDHYFNDNRAYAEAWVRPVASFSINLVLTGDILRFGGLENRTDDAFGANLFGTWSATEWLNVTAGGLVTGRYTNLVTDTTGVQSYLRVIANAGVQMLF